MNTTETRTSIRCGSCKELHSSVDEVRTCYVMANPPLVVLEVTKNTGESAVLPPVLAPRPHSLDWLPEVKAPARVGSAGGSSDLATEKQLDFIAKLRKERGIDVDGAEPATKQEASAMIEYLLAQPKLAPVSAQATALSSPVVPPGRYALEHESVLKFYKIDAPTEGRWAGYVFVKVMASDDEHRVSQSTKDFVLAEVAKDPQAASTRYGREIGACGVCGRTLTDEGSRAAGIGPICAENKGWA